MNRAGAKALTPLMTARDMPFNVARVVVVGAVLLTASCASTRICVRISRLREEHAMEMRTESKSHGTDSDREGAYQDPKRYFESASQQIICQRVKTEENWPCNRTSLQDCFGSDSELQRREDEETVDALKKSASGQKCRN